MSRWNQSVRESLRAQILVSIIVANISPESLLVPYKSKESVRDSRVVAGGVMGVAAKRFRVFVPPGEPFDELFPVGTVRNELASVKILPRWVGDKNDTLKFLRPVCRHTASMTAISVVSARFNLGTVALVGIMISRLKAAETAIGL